MCLGLALFPLASCRTTLDSVGCSESDLPVDGGAAVDGGSGLLPLLGPLSYPNAFRDVLGKSDSDIATKIDSTFNQLFHGDSLTQAIYYPVNGDQAYIRDTYHDDIRTEGMGLGMIVTVELDKRDEFDRLWRYVKATQIQSGPSQGYFPSLCGSSVATACNDPFGLQQITTALLLARGRWQDTPGPIDYGQEARSLLDIIRHKETYNCEIVDKGTGTFDPNSALPYDTPTTASANISRPSIAMPAYYELWRQATGDPFWSKAAAAARAYWQASANPTTGLMPQRATFDGTPVAGSDTFEPEGYRTLIDITLDRVWFGSENWVVDESNLLLQFFDGQGLATYGGIYSLDGNVIDPSRDMSLDAANGAIALIASTDKRTEFINAVWNIDLPIGIYRYYAGILDMLALLVLSGQMQVY
jgi:oligosaccharide reducing-end xylanase